MVQGTMSNVGKSLLCAGLCRIFRQDGFRTAPFKSQNMALNSYITKDGLEMGRAQVLQAQAAGVDPEVWMNPILLKPTNATGSQVIVNGEVYGNLSAREYFSVKKQLWPQIRAALEKLNEWADIIVIEGAGSPAEINLRANDIVNMGLAEAVDAPVLLAGDIDRGGVFAQLLGTLDLLQPSERRRVQGLIINKFRGDKTILDPGIHILEEKGKVPVVGVIPYTHLQLEDEDSLSERFDTRAAGLIDLAVIRFPRISNYTDFDVFEQFPGVSVRYVDRADRLGNPDMILLPGSKNTIEDLKWMRESGLEVLVLQKSSTVPVFGICGGYQMMGKVISDPEGVECGETIRGMNLLPCETVLTSRKKRTQFTGRICNVEGMFSGLSGQEIKGYEIHMGRTVPSADETGASGNGTGGTGASGNGTGGTGASGTDVNGTNRGEDTQRLREFTAEGTGCFCNNAYGTYIHGIFDKGSVAACIIEALAGKKGIRMEMLQAMDLDSIREREFDTLARVLRENMDIRAVYEMLRELKL